jgi:hypothetical protein
LVKDNQYWREIRCNEPTWKGEQTVDIRRNVRLAHSSVHTICNNADKIKVSAKCLDNITCQQSDLKQGLYVCIKGLQQSYQDEPYQIPWMWVSYIITELEINKYIIHKCIYRAYTLYRSICPLVLYSYTKQDEVVDPVTSKKYIVFKRNYVFDMHDVSQEHKPGVKWDLSVFKAFTHPWKEQKYNCEAKGIFGLELERGKF